MELLRRHADWLFGLMVAALLVLFPLASHLRLGDQVIAHDAHLPATAAKALDQIHVLRPINGGMVQAIAAPISFNTTFVYGLPLALGVRSTIAQALAMTATFALALILAVIGFERLLVQWDHPRGAMRRVDACLLGALYVVSPFTLIYMSYGIFWTVNIALAIGVLPLLFHFHYRCFVEESDRFVVQSVAGLAACFIALTWSILFIFPAVVMMALAFIVRGRINRLDAAKALALGMSVFVGSLPALYGMYLSAMDAGWREAADPVTANAAFEAIRGGVLTGFLQHAAWPIYTPWTPRLVLGFPEHFTSGPYVAVSFLLLGMAVVLPLLDRRPQVVRRSLYFLLVLLVAVFLLKGAGQPFGEVFRALFEFVPGAGLIRTPDTKLGVFVILALACSAGLLLASEERRLAKMRSAMRVVIAASIAYHSIPLLTGSAILARDSQLAEGGGRGYAVTPSAAERRMVEILGTEPSAGVVVLPPGFGVATKRGEGVFAYRHVITEFASNPFFYAAWDEAPSRAVKQRLEAGVKEGDWRSLRDLGVGFVMVDRNALGDTAVGYELYGVVRRHQAWTLMLDEGGYELYRLADAYRAPFAQTDSAGGSRDAELLAAGGWYALLKTAAIDSSFSITVRGPENRHWALLVLPRGCSRGLAVCGALSFLHPERSIVRTGTPWSELSNQWKVGSVPARGNDPEPQVVAVIFMPQLLMMLFVAISVATVLGCLYLGRLDATSRRRGVR